ncbi:MAG: hypothetical protein GVY35_16165 [Bacteroidetes bacterium]|jgi:hypothetical protein|nr:hypothetical protein [Bacteroidota bacterium]
MKSHKVSLQHFETQYARATGGWSAARSDGPKDYASFLQGYVDHRLKVMAAREAGIHRVPALRTQMQRYRRQMARVRLRSDSVLAPVMRALHEQRAAAGSSVAPEELRRTAEQLPGIRAAERAFLDRLHRRTVTHVDTAALTRSLAVDRLDRAARLHLRAPHQPDASVVTVQDTTYTTASIATFWQTAPDLRHASIGHAVEAFTRSAVLDHAAQRLKDTDPSFRRQMASYWQDLLVVELMRDSVWTPAQRDTAGQLAYFETHRDRYHAASRASAPPQHDTAPRLAVAHPVAPPTVASSEARLPYIASLASVRSDAVLVASGRARVGRTAVLPHGDGVSDGSHLLRNRQAVAAFGPALSSPPVPFAKVRSAVVRDYQAHRERAFLKRLRERYHVRLYPDRLHAAFRSVPTDSTAARVPPR